MLFWGELFLEKVLILFHGIPCLFIASLSIQIGSLGKIFRGKVLNSAWFFFISVAEDSSGNNYLGSEAHHNSHYSRGPRAACTTDGPQALCDPSESQHHHHLCCCPS